MSYVEFNNVSKVYKAGEVDIKAVDDVSFEVEKGEFCVIVGASGSGKTTALNILGGMDNATVALLKDCFIRKYFKTDDPVMIEKFGSMLNALRLIRTVFAVGFNSRNTEKYRPAIIDMARQVFFPNIQNIVGGVRYLVSVIDNMYKG